MCRIHTAFACALFISASLMDVECDMKATKERTRVVEGRNEWGAQTSEIEFMKWVDLMGKRNHSSFATARNKDFPTYVMVVDKHPEMGDFTSVQDAIDSIPELNPMRMTIRVHAGTYREKVSISQWKGPVSIEGAGAESTVIEWGDTAHTVDAKGKALGTFGSATFAVNSPYFIAKNITFKNTAAAPPSGAMGRQGVAFRISADAAAFIGCRFVGAQDTLYDQVGRHYYKECYVEGSVDFIFGNGLSLFEGCHMHAIAEKMGAVTAQRRSSNGDDTGFSFVKCRVTGSGALFLGRAWGPYSRVVFAYTYMDNIILPKGWYDWGDPSRRTTVYYGQYKCTGPGASFKGRVPWSKELTDDQARPFLSPAFVDASHWLPSPS